MVFFLTNTVDYSLDKLRCEAKYGFILYARPMLAFKNSDKNKELKALKCFS